MAQDTLPSMEARAEDFRTRYNQVKSEIGKVIVGHDEIVHGILTCLFIGGHALLEGVPGLGKTLLVRTLADALSLDFNRIQFTPDLMPADIIGTNIVMEAPDGRRAFEFQSGPIFSQIVLADEINRATPKTQSALLEAMQEHSVTIGGHVHRLKEPFFVMATQNPIEQEGTYPLPEAQLDRFLFQVRVSYPNRDEELAIMKQTTGTQQAEVEHVLSAERILHLQELVRQVVVADHVFEYAADLVRATRPDENGTLPFIKQQVSWGAGPRASQYLILASKARALLHGRLHATTADLRALALPVLRHRVLTTFHADAEGVSADDIVKRLLDSIPTPQAKAVATLK